MSFEFMMFIVLWTFILIGLIGIGGYFMFRKFLKSLPKDDWKSDLDWEKYYLEQSKHLWHPPEKDFLEELISPVPELFRDVARQKIASSIGKLALEKGQREINRETLIEGYILATPKRDHKFLKKKLREHHIDTKPYAHLFHLSPDNYSSKKYAARARRSSK